MTSTTRLTLGLLILTATASAALGGPHPFHDDGGAVNWKPNLRAALDAAQRGGKAVFLEAGRKG